MSSSARAAAIAATAGVTLSMVEASSILSQPGTAVASAADLAFLVTWLAVPYALALGLAALPFGLALSRAAGFDAAFAGAAAAGIVLAWIRPLARLGPAPSTQVSLGVLLALVAAAAGVSAGALARRRDGGDWVAGGIAGLALMMVQSRSIPGPFGRPLPPSHIALRLSMAILVGGGVAAVARWMRRRGRAPERPMLWLRRAAATAAVIWIGLALRDFTTLLARSPSAPRGVAEIQTPAPGAPAPPAMPDGAASVRPNVILISIDTLRADHLSCYGYGKPTSPAIDRLAAEGVRFARASSTASFTLPAHASMMTGLFPSSHGATYQNRDPGSFTVRGLGTGYPTLAEILRDHGYDTAGFVSGPLMSRQFGFARGFNRYDDRFDRLQTARARLFSRSVLYRALARAGVFSDRDIDSQRIATEVNPLVEGWLRGRGNRPFFLFVHYWDPHGPYEPPSPWGRRDDGTRPFVDYDLNRLLSGDYTLTPRAVSDTLTLYDGEISFVDQQVGRLLDVLRKNGTLDRSLVFFTADHGESFGEHAHWEHSRVLYEDVLRVPFIVRQPAGRAAGTVIDGIIAQPTDILPMALSAAGLPVPAGIEGRDLTQWIGAGALPPPAQAGLKAPGLAFAELDRNVDWPDRWGPRFARDLASVATLRWKYIRSSDGSEELYELERDPGERDNVASKEAGTTAAMRALSDAWRRSVHASADRGPEEIDEGLKDNLRSLGYIQ